MAQAEVEHSIRRGGETRREGGAGESSKGETGEGTERRVGYQERREGTYTFSHIHTYTPHGPPPFSLQRIIIITIIVVSRSESAMMQSINACATGHRDWDTDRTLRSHSVIWCACSRADRELASLQEEEGQEGRIHADRGHSKKELERRLQIVYSAAGRVVMAILMTMAYRSLFDTTHKGVRVRAIALEVCAAKVEAGMLVSRAHIDIRAFVSSVYKFSLCL